MTAPFLSLHKHFNKIYVGFYGPKIPLLGINCKNIIAIINNPNTINYVIEINNNYFFLFVAPVYSRLC